VVQRDGRGGETQEVPGSPAAELSCDARVERILFRSEQSGWTVALLSVPGELELVVGRGAALGAVEPEQQVRLRGHFEMDPRRGRRLEVVSCLPVLPSTVDGIREFLASRLAEGVGRVTAERIVDHFGEGTLQVLEQQPERLVEVPGVGPVRAERIRQAWGAQQGLRDVIVLLQAQGIGTSQALRIHKRYGAQAPWILREDPFRLVGEVAGIGFRTADALARAAGLPPDAPARQRAACLYLLGQAAEAGHVHLPRQRLLEQAQGLLQAPDLDLRPALAELVQRRRVVLERSLGAEGEEEVASLSWLQQAEQGLAERLLAVAGCPLPPLDLDAGAALSLAEQAQGFPLAPLQRAALRAALHAKLLIITGGPGTGKTTVLRAILHVMEQAGRRIRLAAPTGRAAKRMAEACGSEAQTLHRLLEFSPQTGGFLRNRELPLELDLLVVDEASMLDTLLGHHLLQALPDEAQLLLVGDVDQLPSVGPGAVLAELLRSGVAEVVRLDEIFRQAQSSRIVTAAHQVNRGEAPLAPSPKGSDFYFFERAEPEEILTTLDELLLRRLPRAFGLDPLEDVQVLTPMHRGSLGSQELNLRLQGLLNPQGLPLAGSSRGLRGGDKVMQVRNNYELEVFNGDIGRVLPPAEGDASLRVAFDERVVVYEPQWRDQLVLSYACSVHKAQGSEYPCVLLPLHTQHSLMLQRNLLYTAITRGRRVVVVVGSRTALRRAVGNPGLSHRNTRLAERLRLGAT